jgi:hypothetical protein
VGVGRYYAKKVAEAEARCRAGFETSAAERDMDARSALERAREDGEARLRERLRELEDQGRAAVERVTQSYERDLAIALQVGDLCAP